MAESVRQSEASVLDALLQRRREVTFWVLRVLALVAAFIGPLPLVLDLRLNVGMAATATVLWPLSVLLTIGAAILAARWGDRLFAKTVLVALVAGYMATATYDSTRVMGMSARVTEMDEALDFGLRLTGQIAPGAGHGAAHGDEPAAPGGHEAAGHRDERGHGDEHAEGAGTGQGTTVAIGYAWHYWAGIMFSLGYLVLFGARRWWLAILYTVFFIYPGMVFAMGVHSLANFIWEAVGHAGFGLTLGIVSWALLARE